MADRLTTEELDELERLHREAQRGPWYRTCTGELPLADGAAMGVGDACLISGAINALPRLIAAAREAERLRARVAEMERALREQHEDHAECCRQADALRARAALLAEKWTTTAEQALRLGWRDARRQSAKELRALIGGDHE